MDIYIYTYICISIFTLDYMLDEIPRMLKMMLASTVVDPPYTICRESTTVNVCRFLELLKQIVVVVQWIPWIVVCNMHRDIHTHAIHSPQPIINEPH